MPTHKKADRTGLAHAPLQLHALPQLGLGRLEVLLHLGGHLLAHAALDCDLLRLGGEQPQDEGTGGGLWLRPELLPS